MKTVPTKQYKINEVCKIWKYSYNLISNTYTGNLKTATGVNVSAMSLGINFLSFNISVFLWLFWIFIHIVIALVQRVDSQSSIMSREQYAKLAPR